MRVDNQCQFVNNCTGFLSDVTFCFRYVQLLMKHFHPSNQHIYSQSSHLQEFGLIYIRPNVYAIASSCVSDYVNLVISNVVIIKKLVIRLGFSSHIDDPAKQYLRTVKTMA